MTSILSELIEYNAPVFRNIQGVHLGFDEFDDLTSDSKAKAHAHQMVHASEMKVNLDEVQYHAIDFIFKQKAWLSSRFSNGSYPVWYGSVELETSFCETLFHWQRTFLDAPQGFNHTRKQTISTLRTVFTVNCQAALIDLRNKVKQNQELIDPDPGLYAPAQQIGQRIHREGFPGLISHSARRTEGENLALFKKEILSEPKYYQDYHYEYDLQNQTKTVTTLGGDLVFFLG